MSREKTYPINAGEAKVLKAAIYDLSEGAAKQALYGIIQILELTPNVRRRVFEEIIADATKLSAAKKKLEA